MTWLLYAFGYLVIGVCVARWESRPPYDPKDPYQLPNLAGAFWPIWLPMMLVVGLWKFIGWLLFESWRRT